MMIDTQNNLIRSQQPNEQVLEFSPPKMRGNSPPKTPNRRRAAARKFQEEVKKGKIRYLGLSLKHDLVLKKNYKQIKQEKRK